MVPDPDDQLLLFLSIACDTITGAVKIVFLMASEVSFMISFAKTTVDNKVTAVVMHGCNCLDVWLW